jgi:hypothetical protein
MREGNEFDYPRCDIKEWPTGSEDSEADGPLRGAPQGGVVNSRFLPCVDNYNGFLTD